MCRHKNTEVHEHTRVGYPFGKRSNEARYKGKRFTRHCKDCRAIMTSWKVRGNGEVYNVRNLLAEKNEKKGGKSGR